MIATIRRLLSSVSSVENLSPYQLNGNQSNHQQSMPSIHKRTQAMLNQPLAALGGRLKVEKQLTDSLTDKPVEVAQKR